MIETVSIVMTAYRRADLLRRTLASIWNQVPSCRLNKVRVEVVVVEDGDDGGKTEDVCSYSQKQGWPITHICRKNRPQLAYSNQAVPLNIAIKAARGRVLIIQNAECQHVTQGLIEKLAAPHRSTDSLALFAACIRLGEETQPSNLSSPYFFCGSILRDAMIRLGGFDEDFVGWGAEDCDLGNRMQMSGIKFVYRSDLLVYHQKHEHADREACGYENNRQLMQTKLAEMLAGRRGFVANEGREWGVLNG